MALLKNKAFANKTLATAYGRIEFSKDGTADVKDFVAEKLASLNGFTVVETDKKHEEVIEDEYVEVEDDEETTVEEVDESEDTSITKEELETLTVKQLEKYARENEIDLGGATKKADIIAAILEK